MLGFKGFGFLAACVYNFFSSLQALKEFVRRYAWPYIPCLRKRPEDKLHDVIAQVMLQVCTPPMPCVFYVTLCSSLLSSSLHRAHACSRFWCAVLMPLLHYTVPMPCLSFPALCSCLFSSSLHRAHAFALSQCKDRCTCLLGECSDQSAQIPGFMQNWAQTLCCCKLTLESSWIAAAVACPECDAAVFHFSV